MACAAEKSVNVYIVQKYSPHQAIGQSPLCGGSRSGDSLAESDAILQREVPAESNMQKMHTVSSANV